MAHVNSVAIVMQLDKECSSPAAKQAALENIKAKCDPSGALQSQLRSLVSDLDKPVPV